MLVVHLFLSLSFGLHFQVLDLIERPIPIFGPPLTILSIFRLQDELFVILPRVFQFTLRGTTTHSKIVLIFSQAQPALLKNLVRFKCTSHVSP